MKFILDREGPLGLFKGIGPQILKGFLVQGILMMTKERQVNFSRNSLGSMADFTMAAAWNWHLSCYFGTSG